MPTCDCSLNSCDIDRPDLHSERIVKARKPHWCIECGSEIKKGEEYEYVKGLWEGTFLAMKTCLPCSTIRKDYCSGGFEYGRLRETLINCIDIDYLK